MSRGRVVSCTEGALVPILTPALNITEALASFILRYWGDCVKPFNSNREAYDVESIRDGSFCLLFGCECYYYRTSSLDRSLFYRGKLVGCPNSP